MSETLLQTIKVSIRQKEIIDSVNKGIDDLDKIASNLKLDREDIMRDIEELREKGLLEVKRLEKKVAALTKEGAEYLNIGLPEKRAAILLSKLGELKEGITLEELVNEAKKKGITLSTNEASIALQYLVKGNVVKVKDGKLYLNKGKINEFLRKCESLEQLLRKVREKEDINPTILALFKRRKLIDIRPVTKIKLSLSEKARELLSRNLIQGANVITLLTPGILEKRAWVKAEFKEYNIEVPPPILYPGKKHPYLDLLDQIREILISMGFEEMRGPKVELELWNFDALFQAQDHPAREIHDTYFLKDPRYGSFEDRNLLKRIAMTHENGWVTGSKGWGYKWDPKRALRLILRTQTTAVSARTLYSKGDGEYRCFSLDRVFRPENLDAKHSMEFYQLEGIIVGEKVNFRHLIGFFYEIARRLGLGTVKIKPAYFPFTEPSVEGFIKHEKLGWIEVFPGGMFRPEMLLPLGIKRSKVAAWGIGIDRIAMSILGIDDIRLLFTQDLQFLRDSKKPVLLNLIR